jgi:hypothetical protein
LIAVDVIDAKYNYGVAIPAIDLTSAKARALKAVLGLVKKTAATRTSALQGPP